MRLLIDGHNLIGQMSGMSLADPDDEQQLVARLGANRGHWRGEITVVFDPARAGGPPLGSEWHEGGIRVLFARPGERADDLIGRLLRRVRDRRGWTVVSSDRGVQAEARRLGASVIPAHEFARVLRPQRAPQEPAQKEEPPSPSEVEAWLRIFADGPKRG